MGFVTFVTFCPGNKKEHFEYVKSCFYGLFMLLCFCYFSGQHDPTS